MNHQQQGKFTLNRHNAVFLGLCLGCFVLLLLIGIVPLKAKHYALDQETLSLKAELAAQQQNQASIAMVESLLAKLDQQPTPQAVALTPLPQDKTALITTDIQTIATATSLALTRVEPLLDNKTSWQSLTVHAELRGLFPDLRPFLLKLLALPYVKQIDRLEIHPDNTGLRFSLTYTISLA